MASIKSSLAILLAQMFDKAHMEEDPYLSSVMISNHGIPLDALVQAPSVQAITTSFGTVKSAVFESQSCFLDKDRAVRPWTRPEANTLILRDIPSATTTKDDILAIFSSDTGKGMCPTPVSVRAEMNDTWFVTFASEVDSKDALLALTSQKRDCGGKRVSARLKTTSAKPLYTGPIVAPPAGTGTLSPYTNYNEGPFFPGAFPGAPPPPPHGDPTAGGGLDSSAPLDGVHMFQGMPIYPQSSMPYAMQLAHGAPGYGAPGQGSNGFMAMNNMMWPMGVHVVGQQQVVPNSPKGYRGNTGNNGYSPTGGSGGYHGGGRGGHRAGPTYNGNKREGGAARGGGAERRSRDNSMGSMGSGGGGEGGGGSDTAAGGGRRQDQQQQGQWNGYGIRHQQHHNHQLQQRGGALDANGMMYPPMQQQQQQQQQQQHVIRADGSMGRGGRGAGRGGGQGRGGGGGGGGSYRDGSHGNSHSVESSPINRHGGASKRTFSRGMSAEGDALLPEPLMSPGTGHGQGQQQDHEQRVSTNGTGAGPKDRQKPPKEKQGQGQGQGQGQQEPAQAHSPSAATEGGRVGPEGRGGPQPKRHPKSATEQGSDTAATTTGSRNGVSAEPTKKKSAHAKLSGITGGKGGDRKAGGGRTKPSHATPDFNMERDFPTTIGVTSTGTAAAGGGGSNGANAGNASGSAAEGEGGGWAAIARRAQSDAGNQATAAAIKQDTTPAPASTKHAAAGRAAAAPSPIQAPVPATAASTQSNEIPAIVFGSFGSSAESVLPIAAPASGTSTAAAAASAPAKPTISMSSQGTQTATKAKESVITARPPAAQSTAAAAAVVAPAHASARTTSSPPGAASNANANDAESAVSSEGGVGAVWGLKRSFADVMKVGK